MSILFHVFDDLPNLGFRVLLGHVVVNPAYEDRPLGTPVPSAGVPCGITRSGLKNLRGSGFQPRLNANLTKIAPRWRSHDCPLEPNQLFKTASRQQRGPLASQNPVSAMTVPGAYRDVQCILVGHRQVFRTFAAAHESGARQ